MHNWHLTGESLDFMRVQTLCTKGMQNFKSNKINDLVDSSDHEKINFIYFLLDLTHLIFVNKSA